MKMLNVKLDDWTHRNLKALAALKEMTVAAVLKMLVGKEIEKNPEYELCRKYDQDPSEAKEENPAGPRKTTRKKDDNQ